VQENRLSLWVCVYQQLALTALLYCFMYLGLRQRSCYLQGLIPGPEGVNYVITYVEIYVCITQVLYSVFEMSSQIKRYVSHHTQIGNVMG
jgi:hypothetical protein